MCDIQIKNATMSRNRGLTQTLTGYTSDIEIYQGSRNHPPTQHGATYDLIIRLLTASDCFNQGYHCVMDNFFSSPKLFLDLFSQHVHCTGTVRANRKGLPKALVKSTLANKEVCERRKGPLLAVAYKDGGKKPLLLSTHAHGGFVNVRTARRTAVQKKPHVVVEYNQHMGGVDLSDMRLYKYLDERRTLKWTKKVVFALFGRALVNAYIIYVKNTDHARKMARYDLLVDVVESLVERYQPPHTPIARHRRTQAQIEHDQQQQPPVPGAFVIAPNVGHHGAGDAPVVHTKRHLLGGKRRNCVMNHGRRKRTAYQCVECDVGLCVPDCFDKYPHQAGGH